MDEATVKQVLELMDDELVFEISYRLRDDLRPEAAALYTLVRQYLDQSFL